MTTRQGSPHAVLRRIVETCASALALHRDAARDPRALDPAVAALRAHIDDCWFEPLDVGAFARARGAASRTLARRFHRAFGLSPRQYQQRMRCEEAHRMLRESDADLTEIAHDCGYYDSAHFSREFKRRFGVSPQRYRRAIPR